MTSAEPAPLTDAAVTQRARLHTLMQRRRRLWRRIAILVAVMAVMVFVSLLNRDTEHLRAQRRLGQMVAAELQKEFEVRRGAPLMFPTRKDPREDPLSRELKRLTDEIKLAREQEASDRDLAELERAHEEVKRELAPLVARREQLEIERKRHYFNMFYVGELRLRPEVGVCCLEKPVRFFVRTEGRIVVLFDGEHFKSQWMPEREFRAKAERLGFGDLLGE